jgi:hypothetical protein
MQTSTTGPRPKKPEIQEWENEGGATRPPPPERDSLSHRVEERVRTLAAPVECRAAATTAGPRCRAHRAHIGSRLRGAAGSALRLASKPLLLGAAKALDPFGK